MWDDLKNQRFGPVLLIFWATNQVHSDFSQSYQTRQSSYKKRIYPARVETALLGLREQCNSIFGTHAELSRFKSTPLGIEKMYHTLILAPIRSFVHPFDKKKETLLPTSLSLRRIYFQLCSTRVSHSLFLIGKRRNFCTCRISFTCRWGWSEWNHQ